MSFGWINVFGIIIVILILIPNIIYAVRFPEITNKCKNKAMNILEQLGRYSSMFFIVVSLGSNGFDFSSPALFPIYTLGNGILILYYWVTWGLYFKNKTTIRSITLAVLPTLIFLLSGITLVYVPLIISAAIFGIGHIYVTYKNT